MAFVTARPASTQNNTLCRICHGQYLEELSVHKFCEKKRYGKDNEYSVIELEVDLCQGCCPPVWTTLGDAAAAICGRDSAKVYKLAFTTRQHSELLACAPVAAVVGAPDKVQNANVQMANLRGNSPGKQDGVIEDAVYKFAVCVLWPYVATLLTSGEANQASSYAGCLQRVLYNETNRRCRLRSVRHVDVVRTQALEKDSEEKKEFKSLGKSVTKDELRSIFVELNPKDDADKIAKRVAEVWDVTMEEGLPPEAPVPKCVGHTYVFDEGCKTKNFTEEDILAIKFGPTTVDKVFYANTPSNIDEAIDKRITQKNTKLTLTTDERAELERITDAFIKEMQGYDAKTDSYKGSDKQHSWFIRNIATQLLFGDVAPKKWTAKRAERALEGLMQKYAPRYEFKCSVKLEPMQKGKPPRMIIADQDVGAVMSALCIGVLERYICKFRGKQTIKGKAKDKRMFEICQQTQELIGGQKLMEAFLMENDGSAWDTCCTKKLRDSTENKIMDYLLDTLSFLVVPYNHFQEARKNANKCETLKLSMSAEGVKHEKWNGTIPRGLYKIEGVDKKTTEEEEKKIIAAILKKNVHTYIDSIRRSGDKGTSILNWVVNMLCWFWVLCGNEAVAAWSLGKKTLVDYFGITRHFHIWCEGDDSLVWLTGAVFTKTQLTELEDRWIRLGHRPKLFLRKEGDEAEFCGWKVIVDKYGLVTDTAMPDLPRMMQNCFYTTAKEAILASRLGQANLFAKLVGPGVVARAGSIASKAPSIARWLLDYTAALGDGSLHAEDMKADDLYRLNRNDLLEDVLPERWKSDDQERILDYAMKFGDFVENVEESISNSIAAQGLDREAELAIQHKWVRTKEEWNDMLLRLQCVVPGSSEAEFRAIFPRWTDNAGVLQGICK